MDSYKDITPRFGAAYDLFGNGRTAIKASVGKFLEGVGVQLTYANANPTLRVPTTTGPFGTVGVSRSWTDRNNNLVPDCDLLNPQAQTDTVDLCGQMSNVRFGQNVLTGNFDPDLLEGWGVRASDWSLGLSVQQQIFSRMSVEVGYYRRWFDGFTLTDNLAAGPSDYTKYHIIAPLDPRLPGGGGYPVNELYDVIPTLSGQINNLSTLASKYGRWYQYFNGVDVTFSLRTAGGMSFQGGTSTGQNVADNCGARANLPELNVGLGAGLVGSTVSTTSPYCHVAYGVLTQFRGLGSYTIPKIDVQISGVFQSKPGALLAANYAVPAATVAQTLGRLPSGGVPNVTVNLIEPGSLYGDRLNQFDIRVAKILRYGGTRTMIGLDLYNVLNSGAILTYNNAFVPNGPWLQPNSVLTPRLARISAEFTF